MDNNQLVKDAPRKNLGRQFLGYSVMAGFGYIADFGTLFLLHSVFGVHYLIATALGFILGLVVVYVTSKRFVFGDSKLRSQTLEVSLFALVGLVGLGILSLLMYILAGIIGVNYLIAKVVATIAVYVWNFFARRSLYHN